jgi:hypothetical protein
MVKCTEAREEIQRATAMTKTLRKQELLADLLGADCEGGLISIGAVPSFETRFSSHGRKVGCPDTYPCYRIVIMMESRHF